MSSTASKNISDVAIDTPDFVQALNSCIFHAAEHYGLSITDISASMEASSNWTVFKWIESGKMPLCEIAKFEDACHARFVTRYLAEHAGLLLLPKPKATDNPTQTLLGAHKAIADALSHAANFWDGKGDKKQALKTIDTAMEALACQRKQITDA